MIKEAILKLAQRNDLTAEEALEVMNEIMDGKASPVQMSSYLTALSLKGENIEEITGSAKGMRDHCIRLLHEMDWRLSEQEETEQIRLIFPPHLLWSSRRAAFRLQNTGTGRHPAKAGRPMFWKRWESGSRPRRKKVRPC